MSSTMTHTRAPYLPDERNEKKVYDVKNHSLTTQGWKIQLSMYAQGAGSVAGNMAHPPRFIQDILVVLRIVLTIVENRTIKYHDTHLQQMKTLII